MSIFHQIKIGTSEAGILNTLQEAGKEKQRSEPNIFIKTTPLLANISLSIFKNLQ